ncbi:OsmC family protein [Thermithiobacillus plumbiphilus]|uniref:OsmC family protein n=1 Tax=Thermithiobacillus plumbiphilus TaxID=1729899 RepID=A0ABU9DCR9_9PROT
MAEEIGGYKRICKKSDESSMSSVLSPVEHLAIALGSCLLLFARRFLDRREMVCQIYAAIYWQVDYTTAKIKYFLVELELSELISSSDVVILRRILTQCPIHKVLHGNVPVEIAINVGCIENDGYGSVKY